MIAGIDGCEDGWMVAIEASRGTIDILVVDRIEDILRDDPDLLVIDIPIGLLNRTPRAADRAARQLLKGRSSCVFNAPIRPILDAATYAEANRMSRELDGKGCSAQGFALVPKVREVDALVRTKPAVVIAEGHPEVSFALMNNGVALSDSKHSPAGVLLRTGMLSTALGGEITSIVNRYPRNSRVDVLDSLALLWTARRLKAAKAQRFPSHTCERDEFGIEAVINA